MEANNKLRLSLLDRHNQIPHHMSSWNIDAALECAQQKLKLMETVKEQMWSLMPSTLLELYEMCQIAKVHIFNMSIEELRLRIYRILGYAT